MMLCARAWQRLDLIISSLPLIGRIEKRPARYDYASFNSIPPCSSGAGSDSHMESCFRRNKPPRRRFTPPKIIPATAFRCFKRKYHRCRLRRAAIAADTLTIRRTGRQFAQVLRSERNYRDEALPRTSPAVFRRIANFSRRALPRRSYTPDLTVPARLCA